mmetsp:Transcript_15717/g.41346  ORF Transcript_15717/g.41346 Transcript_15717/m.41346 type:complete len:316 (-) Transcript_15717:485-1432(-)
MSPSACVAGSSAAVSPRAVRAHMPAAQSKEPLAAVATALRADTIRSVADAHRVRESAPMRSAIEAVRAAAAGRPGHRRVGLAVYPGSFNPPSIVHVDIARRVAELDGIDAIWLDMTSHRSQKLYIDQVLHDRLEMAETACAELPRCGITKLMAEMGDAGWGAEYFDALQALLAGVSSSGDGASSSDAVNISWVIGYDVLEGMQWWKEKARVLLSKCARLVVVARGTSAEAEILGTAEAVMGRPRAEFEAAGLQLVVLLDRTDSYKRTSSSAIRRHLVALLDLVPLPVLRRIVSDDGLISFYRSIHAEKDANAAGA